MTVPIALGGVAVVTKNVPAWFDVGIRATFGNSAQFSDGDCDAEEQ
jgi:hypothetical protein